MQKQIMNKIWIRVVWGNRSHDAGISLITQNWLELEGSQIYFWPEYTLFYISQLVLWL